MSWEKEENKNYKIIGSNAVHVLTQFQKNKIQNALNGLNNFFFHKFCRELVARLSELECALYRVETDEMFKINSENLKYFSTDFNFKMKCTFQILKISYPVCVFDHGQIYLHFFHS